MPHIIGVGTAVPPYVVYQHQAQEFAAQHFRGGLSNMERLAAVFQNAAIDTRYFVVPPEWWFAAHHDLPERNDIYLREATALGQQALERALADAGLTPQDV